MGRGRPHVENGIPILSSVAPEQEAPSPVDFPMPVMQTSFFGFRVSTNAERSSFTLRITPCVPAGPGIWVPCTDHHQETILDEANMLVLVEHFVNCMSTSQLGRTTELLRAVVESRMPQPEPESQPDEMDEPAPIVLDDYEPRVMQKLPRVECGAEGEHEPHQWTGRDPDGGAVTLWCEGTGK